MPRAKPWLKMWVEWVDQAEFLRLTLAEQGAYWRVYVLAHRCNDDGLLSTSGSPLTVAEIRNILHMATEPDISILTSMLDKMEEAGKIIKEAGYLKVVDYREDQSLSPSTTDDAVLDRQHRHRELVRLVTDQMGLPAGDPRVKAEVSRLSRELRDKESNKETPPLPLSTNKDIETEQSRAERHENKSVTASSQETRDGIMKEVSRLYSENISEITSPIADELRDFTENYHGEVEWISLAFGEALSLNKKNWRYIRAILEDWDRKGGPDGRAAKKLKRRTSEGGAGAHRQDTPGSTYQQPTSEKRIKDSIGKPLR